jgi:hypothetical protein
MMNKFKIKYTPLAEDQLIKLRDDPSKKMIFKAVYKSLSLMGTNLRHPSLNTHKYDEITGPNKEDVFESYAQNNTPGAYRIFWFYGPEKSVITIFAIEAHP